MNAKQIRDYYEDKKEYKCPLTEYLIKSGYQQRKGDYIAYAAEYSAAHPEDVIEVDYTKASPNQWWHLIKSWCDRSNPKLTFRRSIRCGELYFWMAEVSGVFQEDELRELADQALRVARENTSDGKMPLRTVESNLIIRDYCFDRIKIAVENYNLNIPRTYREYGILNGFGEEELSDEVAEKYYNKLAGLLNQIQVMNLREYDNFAEVLSSAISMDLNEILDIYVRNECVSREVADELLRLIYDEILELGASEGFLYDIVLEVFDLIS